MMLLRPSLRADSTGQTATAILTLGVVPQAGRIQVYGFDNLNPTVYANQTATFQVAMAPTGITGSVQAVYAGNGTAKWVHSTPGFLYAGPTYANGMVIDAAIWGNYSGTTIEVLKAVSGALLAHYNVSGMVDGEPVVVDGRIYFGTSTSTFTGNGRFQYSAIRPL